MLSEHSARQCQNVSGEHRFVSTWNNIYPFLHGWLRWACQQLTVCNLSCAICVSYGELLIIYFGCIVSVTKKFICTAYIPQIPWVAIHSRWGERGDWPYVWWWWWVLDIISGLQDALLTSWDLQPESGLPVWGRSAKFTQEEVGDEHVRGWMGARCHSRRLQELPWWVFTWACVTPELSPLHFGRNSQTVLIHSHQFCV
jgi:hypothetical protein